jgi:hypothetical protein
MEQYNMISKYFGMLVLVLLVALNAGLSGYYYSILPARVGLWEFDEYDLMSAGPTLWITKEAFVILYFALVLLLLMFLLFDAWLIAKIPDRCIGVPNRDYWLTPERRAKTNTIFFSFALWMTNGAELFLTAMVGLLCRANLEHPEAMRWMPYCVMGCFLLFAAGLFIYTFAKFKRLPPS